MSDYTPDSPMLARLYCPGCEPEADPTTEIIEVFRCPDHTMPPFGPDDQLVTSVSYLSGSAESGGEDNRRWCELFHMRRTP